MSAIWLQWASDSLAHPAMEVGARSRAQELTTLGRMIGDAPLVALSEGVHGGEEVLELRNQLLRYLVEHKAFTAIAVESGLVEGRLVHDYVRGGPGNLAEVAAKGLNWGFGELRQNHVLIEWLRDYNTAAFNRRKINFYGFDTSGAPSSDQLHWSQQVSLGAVLRFLHTVDATAYEIFQQRLAPLLELTRFHFRQPLGPVSYGHLTPAQRDALTATIADLVAWIERYESQFIGKSTPEAYAWAHRSAIAARQTDDWMRRCPPGWMTTSQQGLPAGWLPEFFSQTMDIRDRAQADNVQWILEREGRAGKLLLFASRYHLSAAPVKVSWQPYVQETYQYGAGTYLRRRFGAEFVTIGNLIGRDEVGTPATAPEQSVDGLAARLGRRSFVLDLRQASGAAGSWLDQEHELAVSGMRLKTPLRQAFDILLYVDVVTPARKVAEG